MNAITKRKEDGIVLVDREACLGYDKCNACLEACPYRSTQFGAEANGKMQKCDICASRWAEGKKPICVDGCPMRALDAGPMDELKKKYGVIQEAEGFGFVAKTGPSAVFKPKPAPPELASDKGSLSMVPVTARR